MLEYPPHGSFHSFLVLKRRAMLSDDAKPWPAWTHRASERNIAKVRTGSLMRVNGYNTIQYRSFVYIIFGEAQKIFAEC